MQDGHTKRRVRRRARPHDPAGKATMRTPSADDLGKRARMSRFGAWESDWRDQRWETPHGRLCLRGERFAKWSAMPAKERPACDPRDMVSISVDEYDAAVRYTDLLMAFLRAYGAPGLPISIAGDETFACGSCGSDVRCGPCAAEWQAKVSDELARATDAIRSAGALCKEAVNKIILNPAASTDFRPEEVYSHLVGDLRRGLRALAEFFGGKGRSDYAALYMARGEVHNVHRQIR